LETSKSNHPKLLRQMRGIEGNNYNNSGHRRSAEKVEKRGRELWGGNRGIKRGHKRRSKNQSAKENSQETDFKKRRPNEIKEGGGRGGSNLKKALIEGL